MSHPVPAILRLQNDGNNLMESASWQPTEIRSTNSAKRVKTCAYSLSTEDRECRCWEAGKHRSSLGHADVNCMQGFLARSRELVH